MIPQNDTSEMGQGIDRITDILKQQSTPVASSPYQPQAMNLPANLLNAIAYGSYDPGNGRGGNFIQNAQSFQHQQQTDQLAQQRGILNAYEAKLKMGDAQTKALDDKISLFTGNDPEGKALFLQALHDDPESIDPANSYQVMTKLAAIAKKTGYQSPDLQMSKRKELADVEYKEAQTNAQNALATKRETSPNSTNAPSGYRYTLTGELEPIPGGPAEKIPAELSARLGLAKKFLEEAPELKEKVKKGTATGPLDYTYGAAGYGESGKIQRRIADGADALQRMLTGAGMPASEAADYSNRFRTTIKDNDKTLLDKLNNLETVLRSQIEMASRGHGNILGDNANKGNDSNDPLGLR